LAKRSRGFESAEGVSFVLADLLAGAGDGGVEVRAGALQPINLAGQVVAFEVVGLGWASTSSTQ
jgi:hypothetical protein